MLDLFPARERSSEQQDRAGLKYLQILNRRHLSGRETNTDWRGVWDVAARRTDEGWSAEFAIPFQSVSFDPEGSTWGFEIAKRCAETDCTEYWLQRGGSPGHHA